MTTRMKDRGPSSRRRAGIVGVALAAASLILGGLAVPATAADEELIVNGGFENGLDGVVRRTTATRPTAAALVERGRRLLGVVRGEGDDPHARPAPVRCRTSRGKRAGGPDLHASRRASSTTTPHEPATKQFFVTMHYGGGTYTNLGSVTPARGQWGYINATFTIPASQSVGDGAPLRRDARGRATRRRTPARTSWTSRVDDVSLVGAPPPPPPSKTDRGRRQAARRAQPAHRAQVRRRRLRLRRTTAACTCT